MHMRPGPIESWAIKCPDCTYGWNEDQQCQTCGGDGRITLPRPDRPVMSRRATNLVIGISIIVLALLLSWWVIS